MQFKAINIHSKPTRQVGFVLRSHGYKGHLKVELDDDYVPGDFLLLSINDKFVPFAIESFNATASIIKLKDMNDVDQIQFALNTPILDFTDEDSIGGLSLDGYTLKDLNTGNSYDILSVIEHPGQDLIEFRYAYKDVLLPMHEDIIESIDHENKIVNAYFPEGILEL